MMKTMICKVCVAAVAMACSAAVHVRAVPGYLFKDGNFFVGCNYWARHAGMYMWRDWRPDLVEDELANLAANGVQVMRVFPLWTDFQPLTRVHISRNRPKSFLQNNGPFTNYAGVDEEMMRRFRHFCDMCEKNHIKLVVGLVTGWMSGRMFTPPAFDCANVITDPECLMWESRFVKYFVTEMKDHPAIAAWDYGNECNCMARTTTAEFYNWLNLIGMSIRSCDPSRPVVSGMHSCSTKDEGMEPIRNIAELSDIQTTHPYSFYVPGCGTDPLGTMRATLHPTAETLLYQDIGGKPCFVEEIGGLGTSHNSEERTGAAMRAAMFSAWSNDLKGFLWWCNADQEHLSFPPYDWTAYERELGMIRPDGTPKPIMKEMKAFSDFIKTFGKLPPRKTDAVIVVPERTDGWIPAFGAYLLCRQAGISTIFAGAEHELPESKFYIVCSSEVDRSGDESYSHSAQQRIVEKAKEGATVLLIYSSHNHFAHLRAQTGLVADFTTKVPITRTFAFSDWPNDKIECGDDWTCRLIAKDCEVLATTADGEPAFTRFNYGKGTILVCNSPIDRASIARNDVFTGKKQMPYYRVLEKAKALVGVKNFVEKRDCPCVSMTEHPTKNGAIIVAINFENEDKVCPISINGKLGKVWRGNVQADKLTLGANEVAVFEVTE